MDLSIPHVRAWLTRCMVVWIVECGFDGYRIDRIETLIHEAGWNFSNWNCDSDAMLPEAWTWMCEAVVAVRAALPGALIVAEQMQNDQRTDGY